MRTRLLGLALTTVALTLGACGEKPAEPSRPETAQAAPDNPPGIALSNAQVRLPAVSGRPGVAYFTVSQASGTPHAIAAVDVAMVGRTEMHETMKSGEASTMAPLTSVPVEPGQSVEFAPGGKHVMLFDLDPKLASAKQVELTVTFDGGDKATAKARVVSVAEGMEGID
jgi:copper(I)-binding protein